MTGIPLWIRSPGLLHYCTELLVIRIAASRPGTISMVVFPDDNRGKWWYNIGTNVPFFESTTCLPARKK